MKQFEKLRYIPEPKRGMKETDLLQPLPLIPSDITKRQEIATTDTGKINAKLIFY